MMMNGPNGVNMGGPMAGYPTPMGQQAELNYIYAMVEDLSRQLGENKCALDEVMTGVGRVRNRARVQGLGNEDLIVSAAEHVNTDLPNLEIELARLKERLDKAEFASDANAALLQQYKFAMASMLSQIHEYKARHVIDVAAWHKSYRQQLAEARAENCHLRKQMWEMQAQAGRANALVREFRGRLLDDPDKEEENAKMVGEKKHELGKKKESAEKLRAETGKREGKEEGKRPREEARIWARAYRQEIRFWKRLALPELSEDDPDFWSDSDDLFDPINRIREEEKARRKLEQALTAQRQLENGGSALVNMVADSESGSDDGDDGDVPGRGANRFLRSLREGGIGPRSMTGGVPMQRDDSGIMPLEMPQPPPRPPSVSEDQRLSAHVASFAQEMD